MLANDKGFTLIELSISMVLLALILGAGSSLLLSGMASWAHGEEQIDVVQNMRTGMDYLTREIREASAIAVADEDYIELNVPNSTFSQVVSVAYRYDGAEQELERKGPDDSSFQPVAKRIKDINFTYLGSPYKAVEICLVGVRKDGQEVVMHSKVTVRSLSR